MPETKQINIGKKLAQLDEIVKWFESSEVDVDKALIKYQKGLELIEELNVHLKTAQIKVEKINRKFNLK